MTKQDDGFLNTLGNTPAARNLMDMLSNDKYRQRKLMKSFNEFNTILYEIVFSDMVIPVKIRTLTSVYKEYQKYFECSIKDLPIKTHSLNVLKARYASGMKKLLDRLGQK
jgi:hypothetical protein